MHQTRSTVMPMDDEGADEGLYQQAPEPAGAELAYMEMEAYMVPGSFQLDQAGTQASA